MKFLLHKVSGEKLNNGKTVSVVKIDTIQDLKKLYDEYTELVINFGKPSWFEAGEDCDGEIYIADDWIDSI